MEEPPPVSGSCATAADDASDDANPDAIISKFFAVESQKGHKEKKEKSK